MAASAPRDEQHTRLRQTVDKAQTRPSWADYTAALERRLLFTIAWGRWLSPRCPRGWGKAACLQRHRRSSGTAMHRARVDGPSVGSAPRLSARTVSSDSSKPTRNKPSTRAPSASVARCRRLPFCLEWVAGGSLLRPSTSPAPPSTAYSRLHTRGSVPHRQEQKK